MNMRQIKSAIVSAVVVLGLGACTSVPVYNVSYTSASGASGKSLQASQVRQAIVTAVVDIPYNATRYSIQFKSGEDLKAADGTIHKNYIGWVQNLERGIRAELERT